MVVIFHLQENVVTCCILLVFSPLDTVLLYWVGDITRSGNFKP